MPRLRTLLTRTEANANVHNIHKQMPRQRKVREGLRLKPEQQGGLCFMLEKDLEIGGGFLVDEPGVGEALQIEAQIIAHR